MTNKEVARAFRELADLMELHGENPFKIKSYQNAYLTLRKLGKPLAEMDVTEIRSVKGIGDAIAAKIGELLTNGKMETLEKYRQLTPCGVREMLEIPGFGPKKVEIVWKQLGAESVGELLYACNENRLVELKGFGEKTQAELKKTLEFFLKTRDQFLFAAIEQESLSLLESVRALVPASRSELVGEVRRGCNIVSCIELLTETDAVMSLKNAPFLQEISYSDQLMTARISESIPVKIHFCGAGEFGSKLFRYSCSPEFLEQFIQTFEGVDFRNMPDETAVFTKAGIPFIPVELREKSWSIDWAKHAKIPKLIDFEDIRGVVHNHTTYSDGIHTLEEMALHAKNLGFKYLVISDHSKSAFYANGLKEDRLLLQWAEIDRLNQALSPFKLFKSIESDILNDGSLDYPVEILKQFDLVIASIHSNLKMDIEKATSRLIKAIENPYTTILGHPTGRLLLSREGYPIDHRKVIDACAQNGVAIEINANPYRLDMDWSWIPYATERGVLISVNPDAHSREGIADIKYGMISARKGGLTAAQCLNAKPLADFSDYLLQKKPV